MFIESGEVIDQPYPRFGSRDMTEEEDAVRVPTLFADVRVLKADVARLHQDIGALSSQLAANHSDNRVEIRNIQEAIGAAIRLLKTEQLTDLTRRMDKLETELAKQVEKFEEALEKVETRQDAMKTEHNQWIGRAQAMGWMGKILWTLAGMAITAIGLAVKWLTEGGQHVH